MAKREYLPKNVKNGISIEAMREKMKGAGFTGKVMVQVNTYGHGRDINGNGTAHYQVHLLGFTRSALIVESGARREQVGYSGANEAALWALNKLGYQIDTCEVSSYDYQGTAYYPVLNWAQ